MGKKKSGYPQQSRVATKRNKIDLITATSHKKPKNYWILGIKFKDEEPVILGKYKESDKPICCSYELAEAIASNWSSLPDTSGEEVRPMYKEVLVITAKSDGNGGWHDPKWCETKDIANVARPGSFEAFGKESSTSRYTLLREAIYGCRGLEWQEEVS